MSTNGASRKVHDCVRVTMTSVDVVEKVRRIAQTLCRRVSWRVGTSNGNRVWRRVGEHESESSADDFIQLSHGDASNVDRRLLGGLRAVASWCGCQKRT